MGDLISRSALVKYLRDYKWEFAMGSDFSKAMEMIDAQPTAYDVDAVVAELEQQAEQYSPQKSANGWIPCSERLPEYTDEYNVTVDVASEFGCYRTVKTLRFERIEGKEPKWVIPQDEVYRVIAWCELPAPYTEGE